MDRPELVARLEVGAMVIWVVVFFVVIYVIYRIVAIKDEDI